jgi:hypothetical protein
MMVQSWQTMALSPAALLMKRRRIEDADNEPRGRITCLLQGAMLGRNPLHAEHLELPICKTCWRGDNA